MTRRKRDACQFCLGAKGGVPGNENVFNGVVACDYCSVLVLRAKSGQNPLLSMATPTPSDGNGSGRARRPRRRRTLVSATNPPDEQLVSGV